MERADTLPERTGRVVAVNGEGDVGGYDRRVGVGFCGQ